MTLEHSAQYSLSPVPSLLHRAAPVANIICSRPQLFLYPTPLLLNVFSNSLLPNMHFVRSCVLNSNKMVIKCITTQTFL